MDKDFSIDLGDVEKRLGKMGEAVLEATRKGLGDIGEEVLRLSMPEVPFDKGTLLQSGDVDRSKLESNEPEILVGYNTPYAARLHEHPEYRFRNGRKGKFIEDPFVRNLETFKEWLGGAIKAALN